MSELKMKSRDINLEAWTWYYLTSVEFAQAARQAMQEFLTFYMEVAGLEDAWGVGRTDQIAQYAARFVREYDAAIELMKQGDYRAIWKTGRYVGGDFREISRWVLPLPWLGKAREEFDVLFGRTRAFASVLESIFNNAYTAGQLAIDPDADAELLNRDDAPVCENILLSLSYLKAKYGFEVTIPSPLPQFEIDSTRPCKTGETVSWTGVWHPETGLDRYSLAFAVKGQPMQPAYHVDEFNVRAYVEDGVYLEETTRAVPTIWHPLVPQQAIATGTENIAGRLRALPNEVVPKTGLWWTPALDDGRLRYFEQGERFPETETTNYGAVVWYFDLDKQPKE
jgi:hypothetical protein